MVRVRTTFNRKAATAKKIAGAILPTKGRIQVAGNDLARKPLAAKAQLGFADQPPSLYEFFTIREHLQFVAEARGRGRDGIDELLAGLGLSSIGDLVHTLPVLSALAPSRVANSAASP